MWPIWVFYLMLVPAAFLTLFLVLELVKDINAKAARAYRHWKTRRDHRQYLARHAQFAREAGR